MTLRTHRTSRGGRRHSLLVVLAALVLALPASATADPCVMDPTETLVGPVQITGRRYVDGEETKAKCKNSEGHTLNSSDCGLKTFQLVNTPGCSIFADAPSGILTFMGRENRQEKKTLVKPRYLFGGVETGGQVNGVAEGVMKGRGETPRDEFTKDKGTLTYSWMNGSGEQIIFVGQYKAKYPHPQP